MTACGVNEILLFVDFKSIYNIVFLFAKKLLPLDNVTTVC